MTSLKRIVFLLFFLFCLFGLAANQAQASAISMPTIIKVGRDSSLNANKPLITGLTQAGTEVLIYFNGIYSGLAKINSSGAETDNFYYRPVNPLSAGTHKIMAIARDKTSLVLSPPSKEIEFFAPTLPAPTLIAPNKDTITAKAKPLITGLTASGSFVHIYIDGVYNGKTEVLFHESGTANFAYKPFLNLSPGWHIAWAVAEYGNGSKSGIANALSFKIELPMPAPTVFTPVINYETVSSRPFIVGLSKNDSTVKVYIDHKLDGEFTVNNHESGTANFAYKPASSLKRGQHLVYVTAKDKRGKESKWSNVVYFKVAYPSITAKAVAVESSFAEDTEGEEAAAKTEIKDEVKTKGKKTENTAVVIPEISFEPEGSNKEDLSDQDVKINVEDDGIKLSEESEDVSEDINAGVDIQEDTVKDIDIKTGAEEVGIGSTNEESAEDNKEDDQIASPALSDLIAGATGAGNNKEIVDDVISKLLSEDVKEEESRSGLINEKEQGQGKLSLNLIIFAIFLISAIAWIFWVNRELIKEKRAQSEEEQKPEESSQESLGFDKDKN